MQTDTRAGDPVNGITEEAIANALVAAETISRLRQYAPRPVPRSIAAGAPRLRQGERVQRVPRFAGDRKRYPARREDRDAWTLAGERGNRICRSGHNLLQLVEDKRRRPIDQRASHELGDWCLSGLSEAERRGNIARKLRLRLWTDAVTTFDAPRLQFASRNSR